MSLAISLYIDRNGYLLRSATDNKTDRFTENTRIPLKRLVDYQLLVRFIEDDGATFYRLPEGAEVEVNIKQITKFDAVALCTASTTTRPASDADPYVLTLQVNSSALDTLLGVDSDTSNDITSIIAEFELAWTEDDWGTRGATTEAVKAVIVNDVRKGGGTAPETAPTPDDEWVAHGHAQTLTPEQKRQAWQNMAAPLILIDDPPTDSVWATGFIDFASPANGATVTLDGRVYTKAAASSGPDDEFATATDLYSMLIGTFPGHIAHPTIYATGFSIGDVIQLRSREVGEHTNDITLAASAGFSLSGPTLTGGSTGTEGDFVGQLALVQSSLPGLAGNLGGYLCLDVHGRWQQLWAD